MSIDSSFSQIEIEILDKARKMFIQKGIAATEMKDIASELGCSRSTLYRHFPGKDSILFVLTGEAVQKIMDKAILPKDMTFKTGYDALSWQLMAQMDHMLANVDDIVFMRDFDFFFTQNYPQTEEAFAFERNFQNMEGRAAMTSSIIRGMEDGSIRRLRNPELTVITLVNSCMGMAQRILPREKIFIIETGYGREMINLHVDLLLSALKAV